MGDAGMYAANEFAHAVIMDGDEEKRLKDMLVEFAQRGNVVYGQCNGFQLLVRTGLLPGIDGDYSKQTVTLTQNNCGNYWVAPVMHQVARPDHFAFMGLGDNVRIWCRHGEGKMVFWAPHGLVSEAEGEKNRKAVNERHVLLRYVHPDTKDITQDFPYNPNGSIDSIAGLVDPTGNIIGHMAHTEVGVHASREPDWFSKKDKLRRRGVMANDLEGKIMEGPCLQVFRNIVERFK
jgi:phosphoribosylformylglycinamidine synthase